MPSGTFLRNVLLNKIFWNIFDGRTSHTRINCFLFNLLPSLVQAFYSDEYRCIISRVIRDISIAVHRE